MENKTKGLNILVLKIIAILTMTIDHIGYFLDYFNPLGNETIIYILRVIGRISLPLIIFCLYEGVKHTSNLKKYILRLFISFIITYLAITLIQLVFKFNFVTEGNIFLTLMMLSIFYYFYKNNKYLSFLSILILVISFILKIPVALNQNEISSNIFNIFNGLYGSYEITATLLFIIFIFSEYLSNKFTINKFSSFTSQKIYIVFFMLFLSLIYTLLTKLNCYSTFIVYLSELSIQSYFVLSSIFILFYNKLLGYKAKKIKYLFYRG